MYKNDEQLIQIQNLKGENETLKIEMDTVRKSVNASSRKRLEEMEKCVQELSKANLELNEKDEVHKKEVKKFSNVSSIPFLLLFLSTVIIYQLTKNPIFCLVYFYFAQFFFSKLVFIQKLKNHHQFTCGHFRRF